MSDVLLQRGLAVAYSGEGKRPTWFVDGQGNVRALTAEK